MNDNNLSNSNAVNDNQNGEININNVETLDDIDFQDNQNSPLNETQTNTTQQESFIKPVESNIQNMNKLLESVPKPDIMISSPSNNSVTTDDLLEEYIGKNYEKISNKSVNLAAFFFSGAYFIYRKMFLEGILICILSLVLMYIILVIYPLLAVIAPLIAAIISFVLFNKLYMNSCKKRINVIRTKNKSKSVADLKNICVRKGGTSLILAIILPTILSIIVTLIFNSFFPISPDDIMERIKLPMGGNTNNSVKEEPKKSSANDLSYNKDIVLSDLLDMGFLQIFKPTDLNTDYSYDYKKQTVPDNENSYCGFNLSVVNGYTSSVELINELANYYNTSDAITTTKTNNGNTWNTFEVEDGDKTIYSAIENGDDIYLLKYYINSEASEFANIYYKGILDSINFK